MPPSSSRAVARTAGAVLAATAVLLTAGCLSTDGSQDPKPSGAPVARVDGAPEGTQQDGGKVAPGGRKPRPNGSPSASASPHGVPPLGGAPVAAKPAPSPGPGKPSAGPGQATASAQPAQPATSAPAPATTAPSAPPSATPTPVVTTTTPAPPA
ncbi:hypothetical protein QMK19_30930 [Streptomyces sp. H10-C2]|uniref:hypothetical protein n=1 Tax=unclassified Streptomyces TaxID=2593676 RepID=UPI0024BB8677|nr:MULTISPECIES: hypothetical protein [unclassified Streptomyces]MDJ0344978.1 hypothetical protein [Streptomyces sp. PH10-H1]MDJ0373941.1 hypothetical protein [Streptomyces sp. H10-C2]